MAYVLVVDDDPAQRSLMAEALAAAGHEVTVASDGLDALELVSLKPFALAFVDLYMPRMDGLRAIPKLLVQVPSLRVVAISGGVFGGKGTDLLRVATDLGAVGMLQKPFSMHELTSLAEELLSDIQPDLFGSG